MSSGKTILNNTLMLYFRMMLTMIITLYTSRIVLQVLGVDDYGIYQTVGGLVALLSFINGALSTASSRFLTYTLGEGDDLKLTKTFSTVLTVHIILALIIVLVAETFGLWFVKNKLVIPAERMGATLFTYHISVITAFLTITQVPYNAAIISHEKMNVYAYISIADVTLKLLVVYLLRLSSNDKLVFYAVLVFIVQLGITLIYRFYCVSNYKETKYKFYIDPSIVREVLSYSGWNLWANAAVALNTQGIVVLVNMFFSPVIVTSRTIANQVNMAANQFVQNFRTAANPQIVKRYASGDYDGSKKLLLKSALFSYYLMLCLCLPICLVADDLLYLWLGQVPEYSVQFLQLGVITSLFQTFDHSFYTALYAKGRIKENALISPLILFLAFIVTYFLYSEGMPPLTSAYVMLFAYIIIALLAKPILIVKIVKYKWADIFTVLVPALKVSLLAVPFPVYIYYNQYILPQRRFLSLIVMVLVSLFSVLCSIWLVGLNKDDKRLFNDKILGLFKK